MKTGTRVLYVDSAGDSHGATVTDVHERGPSGSRVVSLELDSGGTKKEVPHAHDGKEAKRTYWIEAPADGSGVTDGQRAAAEYAGREAPKTRGAGYVHGEPDGDPGDATTQDDGPGLGGGGGKAPTDPPPPPPDPETEERSASDSADSASTRRKR